MSEQLRPEATPHHDEEWDAGDLGCGDLVLALRQRLLAMPDRTLKLVTRDPGAPADIPAYCRMFLELCTPRAGEIEVLAALPDRFRIGVGVCNQKHAHIESVDHIVASAERAIALLGWSGCC
jgi:hypothetical protein